LVFQIQSKIIFPTSNPA